MFDLFSLHGLSKRIFHLKLYFHLLFTFYHKKYTLLIQIKILNKDVLIQQSLHKNFSFNGKYKLKKHELCLVYKHQSRISCQPKRPSKNDAEI